LQFKVVSPLDDDFLHPNLMSLASRHNPNTNLEETDKILKKDYLRQMSVLMFEWELEEVEKQYGAE
jgi:hypothetical protein